MLFVCATVQAATLSTAVAKYKAGNYTGCINELDEVARIMSKDKNDANILKKVSSIASKYPFEKWSNGNLSKDNNAADEEKWLTEIQKYVPKSSFDRYSYLSYYYALCLHQLGYKDQAKQYYHLASGFSYKSQSEVMRYSLQAVTCIENPNSCMSSDMDEFIQSGKTVSDDIIRDKLKDDLNRHKNNINAGKDLSWLPKKEDKVAWADEGVIPEVSDIGKNETTSSNAPTDEEIGHAVRTLQRAGINPAAFMNPMVNNEYAQLNALLNNGNNNNYNDYSSLMMNNSNGQISPELMQTIMRQQMMGGFGSF